MAVFGAAGLLDGLFHRLENFLAVDGFLARDSVGNQQQFRAGDRGIHVSLSRFQSVMTGGGLTEGLNHAIKQ